MTSAMDTSINPDRLRWFCLEIFLDHYGKRELKYIFHTNIQAPKNGTKDLFNFLLKFKSLLESKIYQNEHNKLFPPSGITDEEEFDISLFGRVVRTILCFYREKKSNYFSQKKLLLIEKDINLTIWLMHLRNRLYHEGNKNFSEAEFEKKWDEAVRGLLSQCHCPVDMASVNDLKNSDIFSNNKYQRRAEFLLNQGRIVCFTYLSVENMFSAVFSLLDDFLKKAFSEKIGLQSFIELYIFQRNLLSSNATLIQIESN